MNTETAITENLFYLAKHINITEILLYLEQEKIISQNEEEEIESEKTTLSKNRKLLRVLKTKELPLEKFIDILRSTSNEHCANKIEESLDKELSKKNETPKNQSVLKNIWWPDKKLLIKSLYKRKIGDKLFVEKLHEQLSTDENRRVVICESAAASKLTGLGGVGKTLTANWYSHEYEKKYQHVIWIDCGEGSLLISFQKLARDLDVKHLDKLIDLEDYSRKSYEALEDFKCLWVFDNAENYRGDEGIKDVLPKYKENFYCLITSRSREWGIENIGYGNIDCFELGIFEEIESVGFFKENLIRGIDYTEYQLKQLCLLLGNLPLAMQLAVAALNRRKIDLQDYIEKTSAKDLGNIVDTKFDDYEKTISGSVQITLELISKEENGHFAKEILNVFGYVRPDEVGPMFLTRLFNSAELNRKRISDSEIMQAVELLTEYSLITKIESLGWNNDRSVVLSIHRLLQQVIRHHGRKTEKETLRKILGCDGFLEYKLVPFIKYADEDLRREFPKVKWELVDQRQLEKLLKENRLEESVQLAKLINEEWRTNTTKFNYALCLTKNGLWTEAARYLEELSKGVIEEVKVHYFLTMGVLELKGRVTRELVDGISLIIYWRIGNRRRIKEILQKREHFVIIKSQDALNILLEILSSDLIISNYNLRVEDSTIIFDYQFNRGRKSGLLRITELSLDISIVPQTVQKLVAVNSEVSANGEIDLPHLKCLKLVDMSSLCLSFLSSVQLTELEVKNSAFLDISVVPPSLQKLSLTAITDINNCGIIDLPNLKYLKLNLKFLSSSFQSVFSSLPLNELIVENLYSELDFSILPPTIEKLTVMNSSFVRNSRIPDLPKLRYLKLENTSLPCLFAVSKCQLNLPPSVKYFKMCNSSNEFRYYNTGITSTGELRQLDKLVLKDLTGKEVEEALSIFYPMQLVLHKSPYGSAYILSELMKKQIPTIAAGRFLSLPEGFFEKYIISKHVDRLSEYYFFKGERGKAMKKRDFEKLLEIF